MPKLLSDRCIYSNYNLKIQPTFEFLQNLQKEVDQNTLYVLHISTEMNVNNLIFYDLCTYDCVKHLLS